MNYDSLTIWASKSVFKCTGDNPDAQIQLPQLFMLKKDYQTND